MCLPLSLFSWRHQLFTRMYESVCGIWQDLHPTQMHTQGA